jgi:Ca2+-binding RTX toxin-like protein
MRYTARGLKGLVFAISESWGDMAMTLARYSLSSFHLGGFQVQAPGGVWFPTSPVLDAVIGGTDNPETLTGTADDDIIRGRGGADTIIGGLGGDRIDPGGGQDTIVFNSVLDSTSLDHDSMADFNAEKDVFEIPNAVTGVDDAIIGGPLRTTSFDADLVNATDAGALGANHFVVFIPQSGDHANETFLVVDQNGQAGYQAGEDLVIHLEELEQLVGFSLDNFVVG